MKMSATTDISVSIPSDSVCGSFVNSQVAVWANPGFAIVGVCTGRALHNIVNTVFGYGTSDANPHHIEVQFSTLLRLFT
jgi:hypothetical protein